jgi:hypothetical protein
MTDESAEETGVSQDANKIAMPTASKAPLPKVRWYASPTVNVISVVIGLLGLVSGYVWFRFSEQKPDLAYAQQPVQATLFRAGELSRLSVTYNGKPVTADISAVQIAIWNSGSKAVRADDVLKPLRLTTEAGTYIFEAKVRYLARDVVDLQFASDESIPNELGLKFRIFEPGDGAIVQLTYSGKPGTDITLSGVLVGQKSIRKTKLLGVDPGKYTPSSFVGRVTAAGLGLLLGPMLLFLGIGCIYGAFEIFRMSLRRKVRRVMSSDSVAVAALTVIGMGLMYAAWSLVRDTTSHSLGPPFNF